MHVEHFARDIRPFDEAVDTYRKDPWGFLRFVELHSHELGLPLRALLYVIANPWKAIGIMELGLLLLCDLVLLTVSAPPIYIFIVHLCIAGGFVGSSLYWAFHPLIYISNKVEANLPVSYTMLGDRNPWLAPTVAYGFHLANLVLFSLMMPESATFIFSRLVSHPVLQIFMLGNAILVGTVSYWWHRRQVAKEKLEIQARVGFFVQQFGN